MQVAAPRWQDHVALAVAEWIEAAPPEPPPRGYDIEAGPGSPFGGSTGRSAANSFNRVQVSHRLGRVG